MDLEGYKEFLRMDPSKYKLRLDDHERRLDTKAWKCRAVYASTQYLTIIAGALIAASPKLAWGVETPVVIGLLITVVGGIEQVMHYGTRYRQAQTAKISLDQERTLYRTGVGEYDGLNPEDAFRRLVVRCEAILFQERSSTTTTLSPQGA